MKKTQFYLFLILIATISTVVIITSYYYLNLENLYAPKLVSLNLSSICEGKPVYLLYISSNCGSCPLAYKAFVNATSNYGEWLAGDYLSAIMCAFVINLSEINSTAYLGPSFLNTTISIFSQYSDGYVPFFVFNGRYTKIGGFFTEFQAISFIKKYICLSSEVCS